MITLLCTVRRRSKKWSKAQREAVFTRYNNQCYLCGVRVQNKDPSQSSYGTMDHIVPRAHGGSDRLDNIALSCIACNQDKGSSILEPTKPGSRLSRVQILRDLRVRLNSPVNNHYAACACKSCDRRSIALLQAIECLERLDEP